MKVLALIKSIKQAKELKDFVSGFVLPIDDLSINYEKTLSLDDIKVISKIKPVFVVVNKNIHNSELDYLEKVLLEIDKINVLGIIFYDISIVNLKKKLNLKAPLVWAQEHLVTNFVTINYWYEKGVDYAYLSSELTKEEMDLIAENSKAKTIINVFGYLPMFTSRRHVVDNYLDYFNLESKRSLKRIYKENKYYFVQDDEKGTTVYSDYILNILDQSFENYDYILFNSNFISDDDFYDTLLKYKENKKDYRFPFNYGFLCKETIYKVKKDE